NTEAAFLRRALRILKSAEGDVPEWQVGEVPGVPSALMMHTVALGALDQEAEPARRTEVPVVEQLRNPGQKNRSAGARCVQAEQDIDDSRREHAVEEDLRRVLVEGSQDFDARWTVMDLVQRTPEERDLVPRAVPPVVDKRDDEIAEKCVGGEAAGVNAP